MAELFVSSSSTTESDTDGLSENEDELVPKSQQRDEEISKEVMSFIAEKEEEPVFLRDSPEKTVKEGFGQNYKVVQRIEKYFSGSYTIPEILAALHVNHGDISSAIHDLAKGKIFHPSDLISLESVAGTQAQIREYISKP